MSGTEGISRRGFLKGVGAVGALGALGAGSMASTSGWLGTSTASASSDETVSYLYHRNHCACHCSIKCTMRDGRVCLIQPNDAFEDKHFRRVCVKGISDIQHIYSDQRIQTPMKRVGERGEARFEAISWDDAYDLLIDNIKSTWDKYGHEALLVICSSEARPNYPLLPAALGAPTQGAVGIDMGIGNGLDPALGASKGTTSGPGENTAVGVGWAGLTNEPRDLRYSKYILVVGNNVFHSVLTRSSLLLDAQEAGAKVVDVDPNYSQVAGKSDEWVPIQPGTDPAFYLGMASVIVNNKLYDESFMKARTDFPFLVNTETGKRLTLGEEIPEGKTSAGDEVVWDSAANAPVRHDQAGDPALSGEHVIDGVVYKTVFDLFVESLKDFDVNRAAELTHIPADKITEIATEYATSGASTIITGYGGNDKILNADIAGHTLAALVALTGNIGKPGAAVGSFADYYGYSASLGSWKFPAGYKAGALKQKWFRLPYESNDIHMAIIAGDAPMNRTANYRETEKWMASLDFVCAIDMYYTSYTDYADLVLPACTQFENEEEYSGVQTYGGYVLLREKCIDPLFDSRSDYRIQMDIIERLGLSDIAPKTQEEYIRACIDGTTDETLQGLTLEKLVANQGVFAQSCQLNSIRRAYVDKFGTPSGKVEFYYENMLPYGQELPRWEAPNECGADNPLRSKYPLYFATYKSKYRVHNQYWDAAWNNQFEQANIEMNSIDLDARGLKSGDKVRVHNDRGEFVTSVLLNEAVRPGCVRMPSGAWKKNVDSGCFQYVSNSEVYERHSKLILGYQIGFNDTLVEVEKA